MTRIVLAYSGSAATAHAVERLVASRPGDEVVTLTLDLGQGKELEAVRDRALAMGAVRAHVLDANDAFVREYLLRALKAGALADGDRSLVPLLTRPLIAQKLVEVAAIEHATEVAHACPDADDRIAVAVHALAPQLAVVAVPRDATAAAPSGRTMSAPAEAALVEISFERGAPAALNGIAMPLLDLLGSLAIIAGAHRVDAARVLNDAHADLQQAIVPGKGEDLPRRYREIVERGRWFDPGREALDAQAARLQDKVSGAVRLRLIDGRCEIIDRKQAKAGRRLSIVSPGADAASRGPHNV
ncbi:MAG TPA: argininosuccinate synthase domain-containing protein [Vicinamibacterales bacterium]|nr:argininosuccinate synthase domain-containing protein [Vicinamibacterales bacterium]